MALKYGPGSGTSSEVGSSIETPEDTAKRTARNSEGGTGPGSATLLSGPPTSNHSRVLGGQGQPNHAEVPCAECGPVNVSNETKSGEVWSWSAVKWIPGGQNLSTKNPGRKKLVAKRRKPVKKQHLIEVKGLERRQPEQNNFPNLEVKNIKGLVLPQPPRIIKKARRQRKPPTIGNTDQSQLSITKFLEATRGVQPQNVSPLERVPTPVKSKSDTGVLKKIDTGVLKMT